MTNHLPLAACPGARDPGRCWLCARRRTLCGLAAVARLTPPAEPATLVQP